MEQGRPTKYLKSHDEQAFKLCLLGSTDEELATFFDVDRDTIYEWKKVYPSFSDAIKDGKQKADAEIASKLRRRAEGYVWTEQVPFKVKDIVYDDKGKKVSETEKVITVPVQREVPPDPTSALFWLKNRRPKDWRDKHEVSHSNDGKAFNDTMPPAVAAGMAKAYEALMKDFIDNEKD